MIAERSVINEDFDLTAYLTSFDARLIKSSEGRRVITKMDPLLFALVYFPHHLRSDATDDEITLAKFHVDLIEDAKRWAVKTNSQSTSKRDAYIAPRECGKSTWFFLILPMWAAAHGHIKFTVAVADSATQAQQHLQTFRHELMTNELLREDYPELCRAMRLKGVTGIKMADSQSLIQQSNGFTFAARGIDSGILGLKVNEIRPDLIILDDIEPGESSYSSHMAVRRLSTVQDVILPLSGTARVVIVGTVTMTGSLIHQLAKAARGEETAEWISDEKINAHYYAPIITRDDGTERSCWAGKWSIEFLQSIRHTRSYAKNFANSPMGADGGYWVPADFIYGPLNTVTRWVLSIDPAVTTNLKSDFTGLAIVGYSPIADRVLVRKAVAVKLAGAALREYVLALLVEHPEVRVAIVETNQGGDLWKDVFHHMPIKFLHLTQSIKKEVRAASVLALYQRGMCQHEERLASLEEQMVAFPDAEHDDLVDAVGTAVLKFLKPAQKKKASMSSAEY